MSRTRGKQSIPSTSPCRAPGRRRHCASKREGKEHKVIIYRYENHCQVRWSRVCVKEGAVISFHGEMKGKSEGSASENEMDGYVAYVREATVHFFFCLPLWDFSSTMPLSASRPGGNAMGLADSEPVMAGPQDGLLADPECFCPSEVCRSFLRKYRRRQTQAPIQIPAMPTTRMTSIMTHCQ